MLGSNVLDVIIGLVLVYLLLSLVTSSVREALAGMWKTRARYLKKGISELLGGPDHRSPELVEAFYQHPRIFALYSADEKNPSYIPARSFSMALLDMAARGRDVDSAAQSGSEATPLTVENIRKHVGALGNARVQRMVLCAIDSANGDLEAAREELEDWFDSAMDRVSGRYRRRTAWVVFVIGACTTLLLNVDTIRVATEFYKSPALRQAAVAMAGRVTQSTAPRDTSRAASPSQAAPAGAIEANAALDSLYALKLPIGWDAESRSHLGDVIVGSFFGWLVTALAVSLGAPFWFDTLNRIMVIRSTVKPNEKSPDEGSEDRKQNTPAPNARRDGRGSGTRNTIVVSPATTTATETEGYARDVPHEWSVGDPRGGVI
ncbi:MAG: hypothetical protein ABI601_07005 [bacterium]